MIPSKLTRKSLCHPWNDVLHFPEPVAQFLSLSLLSPQTSPCSHFQPHKHPGLDLNSKTKNLEVPALGIPNQHFFTPCSYTHWHLPLAEFASQNTN